MKQQRRSVRQWIAGILKIQEHVDQAHDRRIEQSGYERGWNACEREMCKRLPSVFGEHPVLIPVASVQFLAPPPSVASYEPSEKQTGPQRQINAAELQRLFGTQTLPAIGAHGLLRKYNEHKRKAGE